MSTPAERFRDKAQVTIPPEAGRGEVHPAGGQGPPRADTARQFRYPPRFPEEQAARPLLRLHRDRRETGTGRRIDCRRVQHGCC